MRLLDEPFSGLDMAVHEHVQCHLRRLQEGLGLMLLYVTHNLEEAFALGHRLANDTALVRIAGGCAILKGAPGSTYYFTRGIL